MKTFTHELQVGMGDCDAAGMVYYPRYTEMISKVIEQWFIIAMNKDFHELHLIDNDSVPTVDLAMKFIKPSRLNDRLTCALNIVKLSVKSFTIKIVVSCNNELRLESQSTLVYCNMDNNSIAAKTIPIDIFRKMEDYLMK